MSSKNHSREHHFGATLPHFRSNPAKNTKKHRVLQKINDFHIKSAKTLEVSHFFMLFARKVWHSKRFQWFSLKISKNAGSVTLFHAFLARKVWHSKRFQWFSPKISKNAWSVAKNNDFHLKSAKTLEVSHFFMLFARKVWHSKRFQWFSLKISKNAGSVTLFHAFLARKVWHSKRFQWFSPKISKNAWSVTLFHALEREKCDTPSVFNDFHLKSMKTLEVSHFFMLFEDFDPPEATTPL